MSYVSLDVDLAREIYLSKANLHSSLLPEYWSSVGLWGSVENLSVMQKGKFSHLLLFNGSFEDLEEFSLANFLVKPGLLTCLTYLREALDNLELVYRCVMSDVYVGISALAKDFLMNNVRMLSTRSFEFVRNVFEAAFVRFQMEMRSRDVSTGASPLNSPELVMSFFRDCFTFSAEVFSRDEEDMFKIRQGARQISKKVGMVGKPAMAMSVAKPPLIGSKAPNHTPKGKAPCIAHLVSAVGITNFKGRPVTPCSYGASCTFEHLSVPISALKRSQVVDFITRSKSAWLRAKVDRDLLLSKI
jgi:hypothetical protein